ncbi:hypothetical protein OQA88_6670 [Cercophora sp. LCS_1]
MASPVSIGDVIAMAKIAKSIALAFSKGAKSAPAEFREVENQLLSLSAALMALQDSRDGVAGLSVPTLSPGNPGGQSVGHILKSCFETLKHLEKIVEKYSDIGQQQDPSKPRFYRWSQELIRNYKKIAWTTEAGDLATLRSNLMIHTNSLDLVLGFIINSKATKIEETMRANSDRLEEIHAWWSENLRASSSKFNRQDSMETLVVPPTTMFKVFLETERDQKLLCPKANLHDDWQKPGSAQLFVCNCKSRDASLPEHSPLERISLSPISFPFRQLGSTQLSWTIYKAVDHVSHRLVSLVIKDVCASDIADFEESFVQALSTAQAASMLGRGLSNMLVHPSPDGRQVRILRARGNTSSIHKNMETVNFKVGHRTLSKDSVAGLTLLHYRGLTHQGNFRGPSCLDYAELQIQYEQNPDEPGDVTKSELRLKRNTTLKVADKMNVVIQGVECFGFGGDVLLHQIETTDVAFHMTSPESADKLYRQLEDMRMELFVLSLQYLRPDETVALHLQATEVQCEEICMADAELLITRDAQGKFRLVIVSRNNCTILSQASNKMFELGRTAISQSTASLPDDME